MSTIRRIVASSETLQTACPWPVLTLPQEITSEIFMHCLPQCSGWTCSTPNPFYAPMLLLHVCRAWRSIAASTRGLWANLYLDCDHLPDVFFDEKSLKRFLADCLERAGARPLSLFLKGGAVEIGQQPEKRHLVSTIFKRLSSVLWYLSLYNVGIGLHDQYRDPIQIFSAAPQLREFYLARVSPTLCAIPWKTLPVFTGERLSSTECVGVLHSAKSLVECTFRNIRLAPHTPTTTNPHLKSFTFAQSTGVAATFFQFLTFPALEELSITRVDDMSDSHLLQFLFRSAASLRKLSSRQISLESLADLGALTELHLTIPSSWYLVEFFAHFDRTENPCFLPQL
ncbi:hypothetical protein K438DRAFT_1819056 [Mycena galopus ATCC 62051]|nr:hypothetical protein K438DRAFT_1819056 [Mycena galopus ATCC 62051]